MFTLWEEIIKIIIFCTLNRIKILAVIYIKFDCFILLSVNSAVHSNQVIQSIFLTQFFRGTETLRTCKEQHTSSHTHTHTLQSWGLWCKQKQSASEIISSSEEKQIHSCLFPSSEISMNMRKKQNTGKLIQQGLKGHTQSSCCG